MAGGITFNGVNLQTVNIITQEIDHASQPTKSISPKMLAHSNRSVVPYLFHPSKAISVTGILIDTSIATLDSRLDIFRGYFTGQDQNLDIEYNGSTRRYICTPTNVMAKRPHGLTHAEFEISFFCTVPFGLDTTATTLINDTANTSVAYAPTCTFLGTAPVQTPVVTLTYTAMTGNTGLQTVSISNNATGQTISITRTWASTDVIQIDSFNKIITVNGTSVAFVGAFPEFKPGAGGFGYTDNFTTRTFNFNVTAVTSYI